MNNKIEMLDDEIVENKKKIDEVSQEIKTNKKVHT